MRTQHTNADHQHALHKTKVIDKIDWKETENRQAWCIYEESNTWRVDFLAIWMPPSLSGAWCLYLFTLKMELNTANDARISWSCANISKIFTLTYLTINSQAFVCCKRNILKAHRDLRGKVNPPLATKVLKNQWWVTTKQQKGPLRRPGASTVMSQEKAEQTM